MFRSAATALVVLLGAAACQPVPRPFQPENKTLNAADVARLGTRGGIVVQGADLATPDLTRRFSGFLAAAMRDADIPALTGDGDGGPRYILSGTIDETGFAGRETPVAGQWQPEDPLERPVLRFAVQEIVNGASWRADDPAAMALVAEAVAEALAQRLTASDAAPTKASASANARLAVWAVDGLDDDDARLLGAALQSALRVRGVSLSAVNDPETLVVTGWVERVPGRAGFERVTVGWSLLESDGREIGVVTQSKDLPVDTFDGTIVEAAPVIAGTAADGLIDMISRRSQRRATAGKQP